MRRGLLWLALAGCPSNPDPTDPDGTQTEPGDPPTVVSVTPGAGEVDVPRDATVVVTFSESIDTTTGTAVLGSVAFDATWNDARDVLTLVPAQPLGSLVDYTLALSDFADDDGLAIEPFESGFRTVLVDRLQKQPPSGTGGGWTFVDVAATAGLTDPQAFVSPMSPWMHRVISGAASADYDGDGFVDIYLGAGDVGSTHLYRNQGDGTFEDVTDAAGVRIDDAVVAAPTFVDKDGDGDLDIFAPAFHEAPSRFFENQGDGTYVDVMDATGIVLTGTTIDTFSTAWGDADGDNDLDVFMARHSRADPLDPRFLYANDGTGVFEDATLSAGLYFVDIGQAYDAIFSDLDGDWLPELLIACDHGCSSLYRNVGKGAYLLDLDVDLSVPDGMGANVSDYDNDGDLDWFVTSVYDPNGISENNWSTLGNRLYQNQGDGTLVDVSDDAGIVDGLWAWGSCMGDLDLDGFDDIFHVNGMFHENDVNLEYAYNRSRLFHNNGDGTFTERGVDLGITDETQGRGAICFDYDRDGDIDLLATNWMDIPHLYRNDATDHGHFLNVKVEGLAPNTEGIGAKVHVTAGGLTQVREVRLGSNFNSHDPVELVFGLGDATVIDELRVEWPSGAVNSATGVDADRFVLVSHP